MSILQPKGTGRALQTRGSMSLTNINLILLFDKSVTLLFRTALLLGLILVLFLNSYKVGIVYAHPVCAGPCDNVSPCPPVIKPCLAPQFSDPIQNQTDVILWLSVIGSGLAAAFYAFRKHLLRKDFYVVKYRGN